MTKNAALFLAALAALSQTPSAANAAKLPFIDTSVSYIKMGNVVTGNEGIIDTANGEKDGGITMDGATGSLAGNTMITFTYTITPNPFSVYPLLDTSKTQAVIQDSLYPWGFAANFGNNEALEYVTSFNGFNVFTIAIANIMDTAQKFDAAAWTFTVDPAYGAPIDFTSDGYYKTSSLLVPTPLPAALPMMGLGLAALAVAKRRKAAKR